MLFRQDINAVRLLTINRPQHSNTINQALVDQLTNEVDQLRKDTTVRVLVITGAGDEFFSAGADVEELQAHTPITAAEFSGQVQQLFQRLRDLPIPVIAAVDGMALGGGLELALACDFIFASEHSTLGLDQVDHGLIPGFGGVGRLVDRIGAAQAREALYTARRFSAYECQALGLVNRVCPTGRLMAETTEIAESISLKSRSAIRILKNLFATTRGCRATTTTALVKDAYGLVFAGRDAQQNIRIKEAS